jgi:hypothetical protein
LHLVTGGNAPADRQAPDNRNAFKTGSEAVRSGG